MLLAVRIQPWLYQGSQPPTDMAYQRLKQGGITHVISVNAENPSIPNAMRTFGMENVLHVPWRDDLKMKPVSDFRTMYEWSKALPVDRVILCHCSAGINRSTLASIWLMVCLDGLEPYEASNVVRAQHANASGFQVPAYRESLLRAMREILGRRI